MATLETQKPASHTEAPKVATIPTPPKPAKHVEAADTGIKVKNISTHSIHLKGGLVEPDKVGYASDAEVSNFIGKYLEKV